MPQLKLKGERKISLKASVTRPNLGLFNHITSRQICRDGPFTPTWLFKGATVEQAEEFQMERRRNNKKSKLFSCVSGFTCQTRVVILKHIFFS
jgi:hypothetical protein